MTKRVRGAHRLEGWHASMMGFKRACQKAAVLLAKVMRANAPQVFCERSGVIAQHPSRRPGRVRRKSNF